MKKNYRASQKAKTQFEEKEQASEPDTAEILELSDLEFKTIMINTLRALVDKADTMQTRKAV